MSEWSSFEVQVASGPLHVYRTGGNKPPVVLAHGFADCGTNWSAVTQRLEGVFDVIMYDARGHGLSPLPESGLDREEMVEDLAQLIEALELDRPALVGHSMGAGTVAAVAAKYPDLMRGIVLEDPPWRDKTVTQDFSEFRERALAETIKYREMPREEIAADCQKEHPLWPAIQCLTWADSRLQLDMRIYDRLAGLVGDWRPIAAAITCPTLLVRADPELGSIVTEKGAQEASQLIADFRDVHIAGAGHGVRSDQLDKFVAAVEPFLAGLY